MNQDLIQLIKLYTTRDHKEVNGFLIDKSKDNLIALINDLLTIYINDKNSSTIREFITVELSGYRHSTKKIGYNGYKISSSIGGEPISCEAKPKNFASEEYYAFKNKERKTSPSKLNGGGNFTDYTLARFKKDKSAKLNMLISGFVDGKLIYIIEFPFNSKDFVKNLEKQLNKKFPDGDKTSEYLRSAQFDFKTFIEEKGLKIIYLLSKDNLKTYQEFINKNFYQWLLTKTK